MTLTGKILVHAPNSIYHSVPIAELPEGTLLRLEIAKLTDFIDFLFNHSEHCDHISHREAYNEFLKWQHDQQKEGEG